MLRTLHASRTSTRWPTNVRLLMPRIQLGITSRWNEYSHSMSFTLHLGRLVDGHRVVGPIGRDGGYRIVDLLDQDRYPSTVSCPTTGQIRGDEVDLSNSQRRGLYPPSRGI